MDQTGEPMQETPTSLKYPVRYRLEAALARLMFGLLRVVRMESVSAFGGWLGRTLGPLSRAHRTAENNIVRAMPEMDAATRQRTLSEVWDNFGRTMTEYAALGRLSGAGGGERITVEGHEALAALAAQGRPAILFCAHLGNWEVVPPSLARLAKPLTIVYRPANNPLVDKLIGDIRSTYTAGMAPKGSAGARQMLKALSQGEHVFMVVDQKLNAGMEIPFFGRGAFTGPAVARLAMRFACPVFPIRTERLDGCRFKVTIEEPWTFPENGTEQDVRAALTRINGRLEDWIRAKPGQWLWMHKRWPD